MKYYNIIQSLYYNIYIYEISKHFYINEIQKSNHLKNQ